MTKKRPHLLVFLAVACAQALGLSALAQDLTIDLQTGGPRTVGDVTVDYKWYYEGANIYMGGTLDSKLDISSTKNIMRIEFVGSTAKSGAVIVREGGGTLDFQPRALSTWEGNAKHIVFAAADGNTDYNISRLDIWFEGSSAFCAAPSVSYDGTRFAITSATEGAVCHYGVTPNASQSAGIASSLPLQSFTFNAWAEADGKKKSETVSYTLTLDQLLGNATTRRLVRTAGEEGLKARADEPRSFTRNKVLVEKHTGLYCGNCEPADNAYNAFLNRYPEYKDKIVLMRHNSYTPDRLTVQDFHSTLSNKWGISGWPTYLIDRCDPDGYQYTNPHGYHCQWGNWQSTGWDGIGKRLTKPTYVSLSLEGSAYDPATGKITVQARGEVTKDVPDLAISVFLTQDSIGGSTDHAYSQSSRAYLTEDIHGDKLTVKDGWYEYIKEYTLEEAYGRIEADPAKMNLVVFVSSYDNYTYPYVDGTKDFNNSEVHNADEVRITTLPKTTGPRCDTPVISLKNGTLTFSSATEGAAISYALAPEPATTTDGSVECADVAFKVTTVAKAENHAPSKVATAVYTLADVKASCAPKESPIVFVNPCDGLEYADGETMIITPEIDTQWGDVRFPAPILCNKSAEEVSASLHYSVNMPHGTFAECISGMCYIRDANGDYTSGSFTIPAGENLPSQCEWNCMTTDTWEYKTGTCIAQFTLYINDEAAGTITVKYVYDTRPCLTQKIGSVGYGTLYADRALTIPSGLTAYTVSEDDGRLATTPITDGIIPARTGVILEGASKAYIFYAAPSYGTAPRGCLKGVLADTTNPGGTYVLSVVDDIIGFYRYADSATLKANRAYYQPATANAPAFLLDLLGKGTTDISLTKSPFKGDLEGLYDLQGRALKTSPFKGERGGLHGLYIVGGKKIIR